MNYNEFYKDRFISEYIQIKIRYEELYDIIMSTRLGNCEYSINCDITILEEQLKIMNKYLDILRERAEIEKIRLPKI